MPGMHDELRIVRGIQVAPGDTGSAEPGYTVINLLSGSAEGFALDSDVSGWDPALPAPKQGLWNEVPFVDGRSPYTGAEMNVTETMNLVVTAPTHLRMSELLSQLFDMVESVKQFWFDEFNCQPVFLHWWANGAPGRQYALIMSIDADVSNPSVDDESNIVRDVTLTIEREPYWRAEVPPGANPIYWTLFAQDLLPGLNYDYDDDLRLAQTATYPVLYALASGTLLNNVSYSALSASSNTQVDKNYLTIPAEDIPGDAPALAQMTLQRLSNTGSVIGHHNYSYMVSRSTRKALETMRNGNIARYVTMIPFTAGTYNTPVLQADTGGIDGFNVTTSTTITRNRLAITPSGAFVNYWEATLGLQTNIQRGRFAVFVRCRQNSGSSGDISLRVGFRRTGVGDPNILYTDTITAPLQAGTGNTNFWNLAYMGSIRLPLQEGETMLSTAGNIGGSGLFNAENDGVEISLEVLRSTGTALLYFLDVILLPYDEIMLDSFAPADATPSSGQAVDTHVIDNTGYLTRGKPVSVSVGQNTLAYAAIEAMNYQAVTELRGGALTLEPGVDNLLYILEYTEETRCNVGDNGEDGIAVHVNIVPRWRGIRAV